MADTPEEIARKIAERFFVEDEWSQEPLAERIAAALTRVREEAIEEAVKIAKAHKGSVTRERKGVSANWRRNLSPEAVLEIDAEERGENIAAQIIEDAIRALAPPKGEHQ